MYKISVIIPVYNVEKYLSECLDSVISQSYKNLEIICVNDASTDNSLEILKQYKEKDARILIIDNPKNLGPGLTRNEGLKVATGDYVHFLDSDDLLEDYAYSNFENILMNNGEQDIVQFNFIEFDNITGNEIIIDLFRSNNEFTNTNLIKSPLLALYFPDHVPSKIFRKSFLEENEIIFNAYKCMEDVEFTNEVLSKAKIITGSSDILFKYRTNLKNTVSTKKQQYCYCMFDSYINSYNYFSDFDKEIRILAFKDDFAYFYNFLWECYENKILTSKNIFEIVKVFDKKVLNPDFLNHKLYKYYNEILTQPIFYVYFKYKARKFFKEHLPLIYQIILKLRKICR